jgi:predicted aldo/keto reductase-like oxidoreductase
MSRFLSLRVPISDVLRYSMYFDNYGAEREAMKHYGKLVASAESREDRARRGHAADVCAGCAAPCERTCPFEIPIRSKLVRADRILRLT